MCSFFFFYCGDQKHQFLHEGFDDKVIGRWKLSLASFLW